MMFFLSRIIVVIIPKPPSYSKQFRKLGILPVYLDVTLKTITILFTYLCKSHFFYIFKSVYIYIYVCKDKKY